MPPSTVDAVLLVGWMERDFAVKYLTEECVFDPPISPAEADDIWKKYRCAVDEMPERDAAAPERLPLSVDEQRAAEEFLRFHRPQGANSPIRDVIKIDPRKLVAHQFYIVLDRARAYMEHADARTWSAKNCLKTTRHVQQIRVNHGMNLMNVEVPHGEFAFILDQNTGQYSVVELARHVSVSEFQNRMLLWAGYHRSYARVASTNPEAIDLSMLVALTTDADPFVSEASPNQGLRATVCGLRAPLLRDFFDERFFMTVRLRKKRFELQIRAQCVGVNAD